MRRGKKQGQRGFSIIEAMASSGVLGISLIGMGQLHTSSTRGVYEGVGITTAVEIAAQQAELLASQDQATIPACPNSGGGDPVGCRLDQANLAPAKACTTIVDGPNVPAPDGSNPSETVTGRFRVDTVIEDHPDVVNQQNAASVITVSVCFEGEGGLVREIQTSRLVVNGL